MKSYRYGRLLTAVVAFLTTCSITYSQPAFAKPDKGISAEESSKSCHVDIAKMEEMLGKFTLPKYVPETFDCDDFANTFLKLCGELGLKAYTVVITCDMKISHAMNIVCRDTTCCIAEPQALKEGSGLKLFPGCWVAEDGKVNDAQIPQRIQTSLCKDNDWGSKLTNILIYEQRLEESRTGYALDQPFPPACAQKTYTHGSDRSREMLLACHNCCEMYNHSSRSSTNQWRSECKAHCGSFPSELHPIRCAERTYGGNSDAPDEKKEQCMKCCAQDSESENIVKEYRDDWKTRCQDSCGSLPADYCSTKTIESVDFPVECASCCNVLSSKADREGCYTQCAAKTGCFTDKKNLASYDACEACCDGIYQVNYRDKSSAQFQRWKEYNGPRKDSRLACWSACAAKTIRHSGPERQ